MGIYKAEIANVRKNLGNNVGQKILLKEFAGRKGKPEEKGATIEKTYQNYFMVKFDEFDRITSYTYTDLFLKSVEVSVFDGNNYIPLDIPEVEDRKNKLHKLVVNNDQTQKLDIPLEMA